MARPPKPEDQRAALVVGVRLTPSEKALVDQLTAPGPDGAPPRWGNASGLLRGLLHQEAQRRGLEPRDPSNLPDAPLPPSLDSANPPGTASAGSTSAGSPPAGPPSQVPGTLPMALGGGVLPPGTLLLVWPPGWPLPVAQPGVHVQGGPTPQGAPVASGAPGGGSHEFNPGKGGPVGQLAPPGPAPAPDAPPWDALTPPATADSTPSVPPVPVPPPAPPAADVDGHVQHGAQLPPASPPAPSTMSSAPAATDDVPLQLSPAPPLPPMPEPSKMLARFERQLARSPDLLAKDVATAAGLKPQDVSTFRQGRRITEEKRAMLWTWMHRPDGAE